MPADSVLLNLEASNGKIQVTGESVRIELYKQKMFTLPPPKWDSSKISKTYDIPRNAITKVELADFLGTHQFHVYFPKAGICGFVNVFISNDQKAQAEEMLKILTKIETSTRESTPTPSNVLEISERYDAENPEGGNELSKQVTIKSKEHPTLSIVDELTKLAALKRDGAITEEEYEQLKRDLLNRRNQKGNQIAEETNEIKNLTTTSDVKPIPDVSEGFEYYDASAPEEGVKERRPNEEALELSDKAIELIPNTAEAWYGKAESLYSEERYEEALEAYEKAIGLNPNYAEAWSGKGNALDKICKYDDAIKAFDKAIELNPDYTEAWNNKGGVYYDQGKYGEAITALDKVIELDPLHANAWNNKGTALYSLNKYDEAVQAYDKAIEINPQYASAWDSKGNVFAQSGKYNEAIECYDESIKIDPQNAKTWNDKGIFLYKQDKYDEALSAVNKALELESKLESAQQIKELILGTAILKGDALDKLGKYDEAILAYDNAIKLDPGSKIAWNLKGNALLNFAKYDEAIQAYNRVIELDPLHANAWNNKGTALYNLNKYHEAVHAYDMAIDIDPQNAHFLGNKGSALYKQDRYDEALSALNKAFELNPKLESAQKVKNLIEGRRRNLKNETIAEIQTPNIVENKDLSTPSGSMGFDTCPVCKIGRLLVVDKKKFLGLSTHHDVICNRCSWKMMEQNVKAFMEEWERQRNVDLNIWLTGIRQGKGFPIDKNPPIMLKKNEMSIFTISNISLVENRSVRTGGYTSSRFRVAKGVSVGGGTFRSKSHDELTTIDKGTLILTNQRIVFAGRSHSSDNPLKKIISIQPYRDGIVVRKEGRAKDQQFTGTNKSYFHITVGGRTWTVPITGVVINNMVEALRS